MGWQQVLLRHARVLKRQIAAGAAPATGLCGALYLGDFDDETQKEIAQTLWRTWPEFTGCLAFPVPAPVGYVPRNSSGTGCTCAYFNMALYEGEYGAARLRLLDHIIKVCAAACGEEQ